MSNSQDNKPKKSTIALEWLKTMEGHNALGATIKAPAQQSDAPPLVAVVPTNASVSGLDATIGVDQSVVQSRGENSSQIGRAGEIDELGLTALPPTEAAPNLRPPLGATNSGAPSTGEIGSQAQTNYKLNHVLGKGGMGVVYAAEQGSLRREVAVKMVIPEVSRHPEVERRFISEALVTGELDHPNIVPVHDLGRDSQGNLFMAMKLVNGQPWSHSVKSRTLRENIEILQKVCDAVAFAHSRGIVHRDLKLENVMVGAFGEVLVMDWGIAVDVSNPAPPATKAERLTASVPYAGTPVYMAPEVAKGDVAQIGPCTDIFLLGAMLYEILTGRVLYKGDTVQAVLDEAANGDITPPDLCAGAANVPKELCRLCLKALAYNPIDRFESVVVFQKALSDYLTHEESLKLTDEAIELHDCLKSAGKVPRETRYLTYEDILSRLTQALRIWPGNETARQAEGQASTDFADEAINRGDVALAREQLHRIEKNPFVDNRRLSAIRAAVAKQSASRFRSWTMALGGLCLVLIGGWALSAQKHAFERKHKEEKVNREINNLAMTALIALRDGDQVKANQKVEQMQGVAAGAKPPADLLDTISWSQIVSHWSRGHWDALFTRLVAEKQGTIRSVRPQMMALPVLEGTTFSRRLAARSDDAPVIEIWDLLLEEASDSLSPKAIEAVLETLVNGATKTAKPGPTSHRAEKDMLLQGAVWAIARDAAMLANKAERALALGAKIPSFGLSEPPFGAAEQQAARGVRLTYEQGQGFIAHDSTTNSPRFSVYYPEQWGPNRLVLPVADGGFVVGGRGELIRISSKDGAILDRVPVDGQVLSLWPVPNAPGELGALVMAEQEAGDAHEIRVKQGNLQPPYGFALMVAQFGPFTTRVNELRTAAEKKAKQAGDSNLRGRVVESLRQSMKLDSTNPAFDTNLIELLDATADKEERSKLASAVVEKSRSLPPLAISNLGTKLEGAGFVKEADLMYAEATKRYLINGGNPDLNTWLSTSPVILLRKSGETAFGRGDVKRALDLVEVGRGFSTFVEMDNSFYRRYERWLKATNRPDADLKIHKRVGESVEAGGMTMLPGSFSFMMDFYLLLLLTSPWLLVIAVIRMWWGTRVARRADLYARGFRTRMERITAFVLEPVERLGCTFISYCSRSERVILGALGTVFLVSAAMTAHSVRVTGTRATLPLYTGGGYCSAPGMMRELEEFRKEHGDDSIVLKMLAEGHMFRNEANLAKDNLTKAATLNAKDSVTLNNLAVLDESAGDLAAAKKEYSASAEGQGSAAHVAKWNLARLQGNQAAMTSAMAMMDNRDQAPALMLGAEKPLWARVSFADLKHVLVQDKPALIVHGMAMMSLFQSNFTDLVTIFSVVQDENATVTIGDRITGFLSGMFGYGTLMIVVGCFVTLPQGQRSDVVREPVARAKWLRWARMLVRVLLLPIPGAYDLLLGKTGTGVALLGSCFAFWWLRYVILTGGILGQIAAPNWHKGYFPEIGIETVFYPQLEWLARVCSMAIGALVVGHILGGLATMYTSFRNRKHGHHKSSEGIPHSLFGNGDFIDLPDF